MSGHVMAGKSILVLALPRARTVELVVDGFLGFVNRPKSCLVPIIHTVNWATGSLVALFMVDDFGLQLLISPMVLFCLLLW